jgi:tetratricopeptide (TPR) repeat protein
MTTCEKQYEGVQAMIAAESNNEAIKALEQLVDTCDDHAPAHFDLGNLYYTYGRMEEALLNYEKAVDLSPENPVYLKNLADLLYSEKKDAEQALIFYEKIISFNPEDVQTLMIMGHLCVSLERFNDALNYYNRILDIEPWNGDAQQFLDRLLDQSSTLESNVEPITIHQRCQEMVSLGQIEQAIEQYESLASLYPEFALAHNDLGVLYYQQGNKERSLECYEEAVALEPSNTNYQKNLADFYLSEQGRVEEALKLYLSVLSADPEDIDSLMVAGHICVALGKIESARVFYDRVLDVEPWNLEASEHLEQLPVDLS